MKFNPLELLGLVTLVLAGKKESKATGTKAAGAKTGERDSELSDECSEDSKNKSKASDTKKKGNSASSAVAGICGVGAILLALSI